VLNSQQSVAKDLIINNKAQQDVPSAVSNPVSAELPVVPSSTNGSEPAK
jgi:hypothetical protein